MVKKSDLPVEIDQKAEGLTLEEWEELETLHELEMLPSQEEEDWLLMIIIKEERKTLAKKYLPRLSNYKIEDICQICKRYFYTKGNLDTHMKKVHIIQQSPQMLQVIPQKNWLTQSLPNLEDCLANIPANFLVSKEQEIESQEDFKNIMFEIKNVKTEPFQNKSLSLKCPECNFNTLCKESLETHIKHIHDPCIIQCGQCLLWMPSEQRLRIHKKLNHFKQKQTSKIKNSLNLIKGEAGNLSNPNRGQADSYCDKTINDKRDHRSNKTGSNYQLVEKDSTNVDTKSDYIYQKCPTVIKNSLNLIKGEAGGLSDKLSNPKRGQVPNMCKINKKELRQIKSLNSKDFEKRDKTSIKPGLNDQEFKKDSIKKMDNKYKGGDETGDVVGGNNAIKHKLYLCKLCGVKVENNTVLKEHIENKHSILGGGDKR